MPPLFASSSGCLRLLLTAGRSLPCLRLFAPLLSFSLSLPCLTLPQSPTMLILRLLLSRPDTAFLFVFRSPNFKFSACQKHLNLNPIWNSWKLILFIHRPSNQYVDRALFKVRMGDSIRNGARFTWLYSFEKDSELLKIPALWRSLPCPFIRNPTGSFFKIFLICCLFSRISPAGKSAEVFYSHPLVTVRNFNL